MKRLITIGMLLMSGVVAAGATVDIVTPDNLYPQGYVTLDAPGIVTLTSGVDLNALAAWHIVAGTGEVYYEMGSKQVPYYPFRVDALVPRGYTCFEACSIEFTEKLPVWSCPGDGLILQSSHLTVRLDGEIIYDEPQRVNNNQVCFVTPATTAVGTWVAPVVTFDNSTQMQRSLTTTVRIADPAYDYSQHVFTADPGVACASNLVRVYLGSRFKYYTKEVGFVCQAQVPAYGTLSVTIN